MLDGALPVRGIPTAMLAALNDGAMSLPFGRDITLLHCHVAGTSYRELDEVEARLATGESLALHREPENPYDALAVRVHRVDGTLLGYLPRAQNEAVARLMDAGKLLVSRLAGCERSGGWLRLDIEIVLREP